MKPKGDSVTKLRRILEAQIQRPVPLGNNRAKGRFLLFTSATIFVLTHYPKLSALDRVVDACERHGKAAGYLVNTIEEGTEMLRIAAPWPKASKGCGRAFGGDKKRPAGQGRATWLVYQQRR